MDLPDSLDLHTTQAAISDSLQVDTQGNDIADATGAEMDAALDDDDEYQTPAQILSDFTEAWINECASLKLLPHRGDHVDYLVAQIELMKENIDGVSTSTRRQLKCTIHSLELNRISYVVNDYLRKRLEKIEADVVAIIKEDDHRKATNKPELLHERERSFAEKFFDASSRLAHVEFLDFLPPSMQKIPVPKKSNRENVFFTVTESNADSITVPHLQDKHAEIVVPLEKGSRLFAPYVCVEEHLERGSIQLL